MSGLGNALGGDNFLAKTVRGAFNVVTAPLNLAHDIVSGKNVLESVANRTLQGAGGIGGVIGNQLFASDPAQKVAKALNPVTLGLSGNIAEAAQHSEKLVSDNQQLNKSELWQVGRTAAETAGVVFGATQAGAVLNAAKAYGPAASTVALATKLASGKGNSSDVAALTGIDQGLAQTAGDLYEGYKDAAPAPAAPPPSPPFDINYPDPAFDPNNLPAAKKPNTALVVGAVAVGAVALAVATKGHKS